MDDNTITATYKWTEDEYAASFNAHEQATGSTGRRKNGGDTPLILAALLTPLWVVLGILALREPGFRLNDLLLLLLLAVSAAFVFYRRRAGVRPARPEPVERKGRDETVHYTFSPAGIEIKTETAAGHLDWAGLSTVARTRQGFLFYRDESVFHWAPFHAFAAGDANRLEELLRSRVGRYLQM